MRVRGLVVVASLLMTVLIVAPVATAAPGTCGRASAIAVQGLYVAPAGIRSEVWQETNGVAGLQRNACTTSTGETVPADTKRAEGVPRDLGILGLCAFTPVISQCF